MLLYKVPRNRPFYVITVINEECCQKSDSAPGKKLLQRILTSTITGAAADRNLYHQYNDNPKNLCYHITIRKKQDTNGKRPRKEMTMNRFNNALSYLYSSLYLSPAFSKGFIVMRSYRDKDRECMDSVV